MNKYGLFSYVISKLKKIHGKKSMQKIIYLLQAASIPFDYTFRMHFYGPYSEELAYDIPDLETEGILAEEPGNGYDIYCPGESVQEHLEGIDINTERIDSILDEFGEKTPDELELITTTHKITKELRELGQDDDEIAVQGVISLKNGKFSESEILDAIHNLEQAGLL